MLDMRVFSTDAKYYQLSPLEKCLAKAERDKKRKYIDSCLQQRWNFSPFMASVDGLISMEAEATLKLLDVSLTKKGNKLLTYMLICME